MPDLFDTAAATDSVHKTMLQIGAEMQNYARGELVKGGKLASRDLFTSIAVDVLPIGDTIRTTVGPTVSYGAFVEFGRGPGRMPPVNAIKDWILEKFRGRIAGNDLSSVAWAIAKKIARRGTRGYPYMGNTLDALQNKVVDEVAKAFVEKV